ncbi:hypothetical protein I309_05173 [Cryptococcus deuterogattii LA55]|nr:hypothetical protein I309_05173 [Cryptococcus deuterogattii LA55]KIR90867.1 hypothetical protein I304_05520 [Cryptococcus deuterogattii CBS 10090]
MLPRTYIPPSTTRRSTRLHPQHPFPQQIAPTPVLDLSSLSYITQSHTRTMSDTPSARPRALSLGADARSQDPICLPLHTASSQHMSITSHPQPLAHEIARHYEIDMEHRLAIHLQHVEEIQQQRFNELQSLIQALHKDAPHHSTPLGDNDHSPDNSLTSPPIPHIPSISPTPLPHSAPSKQRSTHTPPSSQPTRSGATNSDILRLLPSVLRGNAFNYYSRLSEQELATLNTWASWAKELQDRFLPPNRLDDLKVKCIHRFLGHNEKFSNYFEDKIYLQQFLFPANTEDSLLIRDILHGTSATLRAQLQTGVTPNMTLRDFCRHVLQIEPGFRPSPSLPLQSQTPR